MRTMPSAWPTTRPMGWRATFRLAIWSGRGKWRGKSGQATSTSTAQPTSAERRLAATNDAEQAAGRLHDQKVAVETGGLEMIADLAEIASHARPDIGIRRRGRGALELAIFLRELVRGGDEEMRMAVLDDRFHALLVRGVAVGVKEQNGDRLHALPHRVGHGGAHLILV